MKVIIIRHGEVDLPRSKYCTSDTFDKECSGYDKAPLRKASYSIPADTYRDIYISGLSRTFDTALAIFPGRSFRKTQLINEVPLRSGFDTGMKLPLWFWNTIGRLQWLLGSKRQPESRRFTQKRARKFIGMICRKDTDCAVITHGFFMHTLLSEMKKAGFDISHSRAAYKNGEYVIAERCIGRKS